VVVAAREPALIEQLDRFAAQHLSCDGLDFVIGAAADAAPLVSKWRHSPTQRQASSGYRGVLRSVCAAFRNSGTIVAARLEATMP
jgi:hypothetical protein